jgi:DNA-binding XRE family transcriptional regulator
MRPHLIEKRKNSHLKQNEMAKFLKITEQHYQRLESGDSDGSVKVWQQLAQKFNTTIDYLLQQEPTTTQGNFNTAGKEDPAPAEEARELYAAAKEFEVSADVVLDIMEDGRIDDPANRAKAERIREAIAAVLW